MLKAKKSGITKTLAMLLAVTLLATPGLSHHSIAEGDTITLAPANLEMVKGQISKIEVTEGAVEGGTPWSVVGDNLQLLTTGGDFAYVQATGTGGGTVTYTNGAETGTCTVTVEDEDCCEGCEIATSGPFKGACVGDDESGHAGEVHVCAHNFPDDHFKNYVLGSFGSDGYLSESEINTITQITCYSFNIHSLEGIKYFTALTFLNCNNNQLKTLDVSNCTALEVMNCSKTLLTTLDVSKCPALMELSCDCNKLTTLDVSGCDKLETLRCTYNLLTTLDVSGCTSLKRMYCLGNRLTTLDVSKCPALMDLYCYANQLTTLDVRGCNKLETLWCEGNQLKTLDVSGCAALKTLNCRNNLLTTLDVGKCTALTNLYCSNNQLTTLNVSGCTAVRILECCGNRLTTLDVGGCTAIRELNCLNNELTTLKMGGCGALMNLSCVYNKLTTLDVSKCTKLVNLDCYNNQLTTLDVRGCEEMMTMNLGDKTEKLIVGNRGEDDRMFVGMYKRTDEEMVNYVAVKSSDEKVARVGRMYVGRTEIRPVAYGTTELSFVAAEALITAGDLIDKLDSGESITDEDIAAIKAKDPDAVKTVTLVVSAAGEDWGEKTDNSGAENWVDETGKTSAEITGNETVWLKEESGGTGAWYALDNSEGVFEAGSRFWVRWLNKAENPAEWENYYAQLDDAHKTAVEDDNLWVFLVGVTKPDGTEYKDLGTSVPLYIQLGDDWDKEDIAAVFIGDGQDETLTVTYLDDVEYPAGTDTFAKLMLTHFSPYAVYDKLTDAEKAAAAKTGDSTNASAKTGDSTHELSMMFAVLGLGALMIIARKKKIEI